MSLIRRRKIEKFVDYLIERFDLPLRRVDDVGWRFECRGRRFEVESLWEGKDTCLMVARQLRLRKEKRWCLFLGCVDYREIKKAQRMPLGYYWEQPDCDGCEPYIVIHFTFRAALYHLTPTLSVFYTSSSHAVYIFTDVMTPIFYRNRFQIREFPPERICSIIRRAQVKHCYNAL